MPTCAPANILPRPSQQLIARATATATATPRRRDAAMVLVAYRHGLRAADWWTCASSRLATLSAIHGNTLRTLPRRKRADAKQVMIMWLPWFIVRPWFVRCHTFVAHGVANSTCGRVEIGEVDGQ